MADIVMGKDCLVYIYDNGIWKLYACARSCTYTVTTAMLETTVAGQGVNATFLPTKQTFTGTLEGVVSLDGTGTVMNYPDLQALQMAQGLILVRFQRTSRGGLVYTSEASFYITSSSDTGSYDAPNVFTIELQGTGVPTVNINPQQPPGGGGETFRYEYTATGGESFFIDTLLANKYILEANKDGVGFSPIITSGTPIGKEVKYTPGSGRIDWSVPFEQGEEAYIIYSNL